VSEEKKSTPRSKGPRLSRAPSSRWMSYREVADHFRVSEWTVRTGQGVFARLRRVMLTERRVVIPRSDVERLDKLMERSALALDESPEEFGAELVSIDEGRRKSA
jgi:hypothetical protein